MTFNSYNRNAYLRSPGAAFEYDNEILAELSDVTLRVRRREVHARPRRASRRRRVSTVAMRFIRVDCGSIRGPLRPFGARLRSLRNVTGGSRGCRTRRSLRACPL